MPTRPLDISVVIATCRRSRLLDGALDSIARCRFPRDRFEVLVADNADDPATRSVCQQHAASMSVGYLVETTPGKNAALNRALPEARGSLLVFADDDVLVEEDWLEETWTGASRWPGYALFGGRILPAWPAPCPDYLAQSRYLGVCFSVLDRDLPEGPAPGLSPFGPNMAVRAELFREGLRFNPSVGPSRGLYIMGSETELIQRLKRRGYVPVYLPRSVVRHRIRPDQFSRRWLLRRGFRYGRKLAYENGQRAAKRIGGVPRWLVRSVVTRGARACLWSLTRNRRRSFEDAMEFSVALGMVFQYRRHESARS